jgi:hypothetical protein
MMGELVETLKLAGVGTIGATIALFIYRILVSSD